MNVKLFTHYYFILSLPILYFFNNTIVTVFYITGAKENVILKFGLI